MPPSLSRSNASAFLAGAVVLFIELAGSKLLAAVFGSGLYVWSALITVTLLSLAAGAWWGGRLADRFPAGRTLPALWLGAGLTLGLVVPLRRLVFPLTDGLDLGTGVLLSSLVLFLLPLGFLAAVPPLLIKALDPSREDLGKTVGRISGMGTAGSCFGALATGFLLAPFFPLTRLFLAASALTGLVGLASYWKAGKKASLLLAALGWGGCLALFSPERGLALLGDRLSTRTLEVRQSLYGQVHVLDQASRRMLFIDGVFQGGMNWPAMTSLTHYAPNMEILGLSAVPHPERTLVVGLGSGFLPLDMGRRGLAVDAVEIDPQVLDLCSKWFGPESPTVRTLLGDGRRYLATCGRTYDLVMLDAFSGEEIPFQLLTLESFRTVRRHLSGRGALVLNTVGSDQPRSAKVRATLAATLEKVFPSVEIYRSASNEALTNYLLVARQAPGPWNPTAGIPWGNGEMASLEKLLPNKVQAGEPFPFLLTDDYCPLDWMDRQTRMDWRKQCISMMRMEETGI